MLKKIILLLVIVLAAVVSAKEKSEFTGHKELEQRML